MIADMKNRYIYLPTSTSDVGIGGNAMDKQFVESLLEVSIVAKGQLISKWFLGSSISSKKQSNEFVFNSMRHVFVRFLEEIDDPKKPF